MLVRRADGADALAMARVLAVVAEEGTIGTEPPVDVEARAQALREMVCGERPDAMWVVEDRGRVVGSAGVQQHGPPGVHTLGMMLLPEARGRGGGRALLDAICAHARDGGAHKVELEVWPDNARAAALYVAAGFTVEGVRRDHYRRRDGTLRSALLMAHHLASR